METGPSGTSVMRYVQVTSVIWQSMRHATVIAPGRLMLSKQYRRLDSGRAVPLHAAELAEGVTVWLSTGMPNHAMPLLYL